MVLGVVQGQHGMHVMLCDLNAPSVDTFIIGEIPNPFGKGGKYNVVSLGRDIVHYDVKNNKLYRKNPFDGHTYWERNTPKIRQMETAHLVKLMNGNIVGIFPVPDGAEKRGQSTMIIYDAMDGEMIWKSTENVYQEGLSIQAHPRGFSYNVFPGYTAVHRDFEGNLINMEENVFSFHFYTDNYAMKYINDDDGVRDTLLDQDRIVKWSHRITMDNCACTCIGNDTFVAYEYQNKVIVYRTETGMMCTDEIQVPSFVSRILLSENTLWIIDCEYNVSRIALV